MKGYRKLIMTVIALIVYALIMLSDPTINPLQLGLGLGLLVSPAAIANIFEYVSKIGKVK